ncbi:MAG: M48 family metalloprotease [Elusimicrobia bacterium]|nr:M48 family metalloprotease [Elusimicrobiota bacterium]
MRHHPVSRSLAAFLAAAILLNCPGPEALAAGIQAVRPVPAGRVDAPLGGLGIIQPSPVAGLPGAGSVQVGALAYSALPGLGTPGVKTRNLAPGVPGPAEAPPEPASLKPAAPEPVQGRTWFGVLRRSPQGDSVQASPAELKELKRQQDKAAKEEARRLKEREGREKEQKLIDRVLDISIRLEKAENDGDVSEEELRKTADQVWGLDPGSAALDPVAVSQPLPADKTQVLARGEKDRPNARGPPAPEARPAKPSAPRRWLAHAVLAAASLVAAARRVVSAAVSPVARLWSSLPSGARVGLAAALTAGADFSARLLMPALFGFAPAAGLWVAVGLGGVALPALAFTRWSLSRSKDPALAPLVRYADLLMGVLLGAAVVTGIGVSGLGLGGALIGPASKGLGLISLAPLLGVLGFMAALPVLFGSGHVAWGLRNKTKTDPDLPLPFLYKLMLFSAILTPGQLFVALSGGLPGLLGGFVVYAAIVTYFSSRARLGRMTAQDDGAQPKAGVDEEAWRLDRVQGPATTPAEQLRRARVQAALWGAAIVLGSIAFVALHQLSLPAALALAGPKLLAGLKSLAPFALLGGFLAALFMRVKRVKTGPYVDTVAELAAKAGLPMPRVHAGKTTGSPNAFAAGAFHSLAVVAVVGTITRLMTVREMRGILGHELSHVKYRHMLSFFLAIPFVQLLSLGAATILQMAVVYWAPVLWVLALLGLTRANERMADAGGAKLTGDPRGLATGLRKLALLGSVGDKMPHREGSWLYRLFLSHPDPLERVRTLGRMLK